MYKYLCIKMALFVMNSIQTYNLKLNNVFENK